MTKQLAQDQTPVALDILDDLRRAVVHTAQDLMTWLESHPNEMVGYHNERVQRLDRRLANLQDAEDLWLHLARWGGGHVPSVRR